MKANFIYIFFSYFSAGPLGALICGFIIDNFGIANNVIITSTAAFIALITLTLKTKFLK